jgi:hypothetical protein
LISNRTFERRSTRALKREESAEVFWMLEKGVKGQMGQCRSVEIVVWVERSGGMHWGKEKVGRDCRVLRVR